MSGGTNRSSEQLVERIEHAGDVLAIVVRAEYRPTATDFITPDDYKQQVGFIVYPAGGQVTAHRHRSIERHLVGTSEALIVRSGSCEVDLYSEAAEFVCSRRLEAGDLILLVAGGHGFRMLQDTVLLELKQGPYTGIDEKVRFLP